jgi:hypothetical protein
VFENQQKRTYISFETSLMFDWKGLKGTQAFCPLLSVLGAVNDSWDNCNCVKTAT